MAVWTKTSVVFLLVAALVFSPLGAMATEQVGSTQGDPTGTDMVADLFLLRPVGVVATAFGAACFLISLPVTGPTKTTKSSWDTLVADPAEFTFARPMGEVKY